MTHINFIYILHSGSNLLIVVIKGISPKRNKKQSTNKTQNNKNYSYLEMNQIRLPEVSCYLECKYTLRRQRREKLLVRFGSISEVLLRSLLY